MGRTAVGIRGLTTVTPATTRRSSKKKKTEDGGRLDRVDRDDDSNAMLMEFAEPEEEEQEEQRLAGPAGHSTSLVRFDDDAFRTDEKGRPIPPMFSDVDQGNLGDAWLLASCAAVAHARPAQLLKRIYPGGDDAFVVRLGADEYRVTPELPSEGYADPMPNAQRNTLWVALVEKAFAQAAADSYANLELGNPARALDLLTGNRTVRRTVTPRLGSERLFQLLHEGKRAGAAMVVRTHVNRVAAPLTADHYYAVVDVYERSGRHFTKLYNPWGTKSNSRPLSEMIHDIDLEVFTRDVESLFVNRG